MSDNTEEYERYTQIAKERPAKVEKHPIIKLCRIFAQFIKIQAKSVMIET